MDCSVRSAKSMFFSVVDNTRWEFCKYQYHAMMVLWNYSLRLWATSMYTPQFEQAKESPSERINNLL